MNAGRKGSPSYAISDSQSVKTVAASKERGIGGVKKTKGRKRYIVVDVPGCLLSVVVHAANIHETQGGISTAKRAYERFPSIQKICADAGARSLLI